MKTVLTNEAGYVFGPFTSVEAIDGGYLCDECIYQTTVTGVVKLSEVADDYQSQASIDAYNAYQSSQRAAAYQTQSDPIYFQWQRGLKTEQEWLDAVAAVHAQYPYK
jgi:hypothetical protein